MPIATEMAGVNMRLEVGAVRELHWHKTAEVYLTASASMNVPLKTVCSGPTSSPAMFELRQSTQTDRTTSPRS